jgi:DNA-binding XRE family transcriptional regulator
VTEIPAEYKAIIDNPGPRKVGRTNIYTYKGEDYTLKEAAAAIGMGHTSFLARFYRVGFDRAMEMGPPKGPGMRPAKKKKGGANNLKKLRLGAGYTQEHVADKLGIYQTFYVRMEKGYTNNPKLQMAYKCASLYGVALEDIWESEHIRLKRNGRRYLGGTDIIGAS